MTWGYWFVPQQDNSMAALLELSMCGEETRLDRAGWTKLVRA